MTNIPRFSVYDNDGSFKVIDNQAKEFNLHEMAVSIYFKNEETAHEVCRILNLEWKKFLHNPY